jgi:SAM-dependent methyltransferase
MPTVTIRDAAPGLAASNLFYRRPELYDQIQADPEHTVARQVERLVAEHAPDARTLLDFGCGTGRDLAYLASHFECFGVDLQPQMVAYANRTRPQLDVRIGDMRGFRLGRRVDVITCLGNSLAYVHEPGDLAEVFATFAGHARPGTLLVLATQTAPIQAEPRTHRVDTADLHGMVTISYEWDEDTQINTMRRSWQLDDGTSSQDRIRRRVMSVEEIRTRLMRVGFDLSAETPGRSGTRGGPSDPVGYVVSRYLGDRLEFLPPRG